MKIVPLMWFFAVAYALFAEDSSLAEPGRFVAERFLDVYGGMSFSQGGTLDWEVENKYASGPRYAFSSDYGRDKSAEVAFRLGGWLKSHDWLALAVDLSFFNTHPTKSDVEIDTTCLSLLCMARYPMLADDKYPYGRLQPYVAAGPTGTLLLSLSAKEQVDDETVTLDYDSGYGLGVDLRLGCTWMQFEKQGFFIEYRYTYIDIDNQDDGGSEGDWLYTGKYTSVATDLSTHHLLVGVTLRY